MIRIAFGLAVLFSGISAAGAFEWVQTDAVILHPGEAWEREAAFLVNTADVRGVVKNDLFIAARTVALGGQMENDVWVYAGERAAVTGVIGDHLRLWSPTVTIAGSVSNHATVFADTADIRENATFARDLTLRARDVIFKGRVLGRLDIAAPRVTLGGTVGGDVVLAGEDLVLQPGTRIGGNLRYTSSKTLTIGPDVTVAGEVIRPPAPGAGSARMFDPALALVLGAVWTLALVFLLVMPAHVEGATAQIRRSWGRCLLVGSISGTGAPLLAGGLAATLVGIPLALALIAGAGLAFAMAPAVTGLWIGTRIIPGGDGTARRTRILRTFAGLAVLSLIGWIPAVGPGLLLFLFLTGAGGVWVHTLSGGIQRPPAVGGCPPLP